MYSYPLKVFAYSLFRFPIVSKYFAVKVHSFQSYLCLSRYFSWFIFPFSHCIIPLLLLYFCYSALSNIISIICCYLLLIISEHFSIPATHAPTANSTNATIGAHSPIVSIFSSKTSINLSISASLLFINLYPVLICNGKNYPSLLIQCLHILFSSFRLDLHICCMPFGF